MVLARSSATLVRSSARRRGFTDAYQRPRTRFPDFFAVDGGDDAFRSLHGACGVGVGLLGAVAVFGAGRELGGFRE